MTLQLVKVEDGLGAGSFLISLLRSSIDLSFPKNLNSRGSSLSQIHREDGGRGGGVEETQRERGHVESTAKEGPGTTGTS